MKETIQFDFTEYEETILKEAEELQAAKQLGSDVAAGSGVRDQKNMPMISIATFSGEEVKDTGVNFKFPKEKPYMPKKEKMNLVSSYFCPILCAVTWFLSSCRTSFKPQSSSQLSWQTLKVCSTQWRRSLNTTLRATAG